MIWLLRSRPLQNRVSMAFTLGALLLSATLGAFTFLTARSYLLDQREQAAIRQTYLDAATVRDRLSAAGSEVSEALSAADLPHGVALVIHRNGEWYSTTLGVDPPTVPQALQHRVRTGTPGYLLTRVNRVPALVVGLPLPDNTEFYRASPLTELDDTLRTLSVVLTIGILLATLGSGLLGRWTASKVTQPLNLVAATAAQIADGRLDTRLPETSDPDLAIIVGSFNSMLDSLQQRVERDARFAADAGHELRSPLTTLVTSVEFLDRHRAELPPRVAQAVDLMAGDVTRLQRLLDDLLNLARADAGIDLTHAPLLPLGDLLRHTLSRAGHNTMLLHLHDDGVVRGEKVLLERAFTNLFENADQHGEGLHAVTVQAEGDRLLVFVDDEGPGVPPRDRERVFERFATSSRTARGSSASTGLGLALATEMIRTHGGALWYADRPCRGARFVASLPRVTP
jgi:two-component system sensor histidine kinase MtrB